jgi:RNA recognition motif-containing protein
MATKLYVGNLSYQTKDDTLNALFSQVGTVTSCQVMTDRYTGESRGFAFVEMSTEDEAKNAIASLDGKNVDGRNLKVNESKPREAGGGFGGGNRGGGGGGNRSGGGSSYGSGGGSGYGGGSRW